jgi:hypothetical protein
MPPTRKLEPHLDGAAVPGIDPQSEEMQRKYAFYRQFESLPAPRRLRLWHVLVTFAVGAIAGLVGAWSLESSTLPSLSTTLSKSLLQQAAARAPVAATQGGEAAGIRAGELPYDGRTPQTSAAPAAAVIEKERDPPVARADAEQHKPKPAAVASVDKPRATGESGATPQKPAAQKRKPAVDKPVKAAAHKRSSSHSISQKDREIDRIRRQATDELKRKNESRPMNETLGAATAQRQAHAESTATAPKVQRIRALLARCAEDGNLFRREICKWRLCRDMWGRNGCPPLPQRSSLF